MFCHSGVTTTDRLWFISHTMENEQRLNPRSKGFPCEAHTPSRVSTSIPGSSQSPLWISNLAIRSQQRATEPSARHS